VLVCWKVSLEILERFLAMEKDFFLRLVWGFQGELIPGNACGAAVRLRSVET
jgi:hypothetical protein